jgi:hypothetical protein
LLLDVTAILSTSAIDSVAEAFSVPAHSIVAVATSSHEQSAWAAAVERGSVDLPSSSDPQLVPEQYRPSTLAELVSSRASATEVANWWAAATPAQQRALIASSPEAVGNLEGIPYQVRDLANRSYLTGTIASIESQIASGSVGRAASEDLQAQLHMLQQVEAAAETGESGLVRSLITLDVNDGGRAVIAVGDLATAQYVSYLVPGMFYSVDSEIGSWAAAADRLAIDQAQWLERLAPNQYADASSAVATVAWIGYQTPTVVNVASLDLAREGRDALTESLHGLDAIRDAAPGDAARPYLSILAHSYGATAALLALQQYDVTVDALAMVGSPGSPAESVGQLKVRDGNVWVADASFDPVSSTGVFGSQPLSSAYGAHHFGVNGAVDPLTGASLAGSVGHVDYFTEGSESFRNMALIGIGRGGFVLDPDGVVDAAPRAQASAR